MSKKKGYAIESEKIDLLEECIKIIEFNTGAIDEVAMNSEDNIGIMLYKLGKTHTSITLAKEALEELVLELRSQE